MTYEKKIESAIKLIQSIPQDGFCTLTVQPSIRCVLDTGIAAHVVVSFGNILNKIWEIS